jgi:hypothetical protein
VVGPNCPTRNWRPLLARESAPPMVHSERFPASAMNSGALRRLERVYRSVGPSDAARCRPHRLCRNGSSRSSASPSPSRRSAGNCAPWAIASCQPARAIMPRRRVWSSILKKLPRVPGYNRARESDRQRQDRSLVLRRGSYRPEEQDHPPVGEARHPPERSS